MRAFLFAAAAAGLASVVAAPAPAQTVDEVVVMPRYGPDGPSQLSQVVSYRDLDLRTREGQEVLKWRIEAAARDLCRALGESGDTGGPLLPSCEREAVRDARPQYRAAVDMAFARGAYAALSADRFSPAPYE